MYAAYLQPTLGTFFLFALPTKYRIISSSRPVTPLAWPTTLPAEKKKQALNTEPTRPARAEEELRATASRLAALIENLRSGIFPEDEGRCVVHAVDESAGETAGASRYPAAAGTFLLLPASARASAPAL